MSKKPAQPKQYFEKQKDNLCGKHAINNVLGRELLCYDWQNRNEPVCRRSGNTTLVNLAYYAHTMTEAMKKLFDEPFDEELDHGDEDGNVTIEAMMKAVEDLTHNGRAFRLSVVRIDPRAAEKYSKTVHFQLKDLTNVLPNEQVVGFINGNRDHFKAVKVWREAGQPPKYQLIDSTTRANSKQAHLALKYFKQRDGNTYVMTSRILPQMLLQCPHSMRRDVYFDFQSKQFVRQQPNQQSTVVPPVPDQLPLTLEVGTYTDASEDAIVTAFWAPTSSMQYYTHYGITMPQTLTFQFKSEQMKNVNETLTYEVNRNLLTPSKSERLKWSPQYGIVKYLFLDPRRRLPAGRGGSGSGGGSGRGGSGSGRRAQDDGTIDLTGGKRKQKRTKTSPRAKSAKNKQRSTIKRAATTRRVSNTPRTRVVRTRSQQQR